MKWISEMLNLERNTVIHCSETEKLVIIAGRLTHTHKAFWVQQKCLCSKRLLALLFNYLMS